MLNTVVLGNGPASADVVAALVDCPDCSQPLPRSAFYAQATRPNGLYRHCKDCYRRAADARAASADAALRVLTFGVEVETVGLSREAAARVICSVVGGTVRHARGTYDVWECVAPDGRVWKACRDGSLSDSSGAEIVTPILTLADMDDFQKVVRAARSAGARIDHSCGVHVHVGAQRLDASGLTALVRSLAPNEAMLYEALGVSEGRRGYCRAMEPLFAERVEADRPRTLDAVAKAWYGGEGIPSTVHYHGSRYHGLNLHSLWYRGTVEFRYFNGTLHAGKLRAYVLLCLHLVNRAQHAKHVRKLRAEPGSRARMAAFLDWLGMEGDGYRSPRAHLLAKWDGEPREAARDARAAA
jgi:hypothetical protein